MSNMQQRDTAAGEQNAGEIFHNQDELGNSNNPLNLRN